MRRSTNSKDCEFLELSEFLEPQNRVTWVWYIISVLRLGKAASSLRPESVSNLKDRSTLTTGLPGCFSSRVTLPPSFSTNLIALSSATSAQRRCANAQRCDQNVVRHTCPSGWRLG